MTHFGIQLVSDPEAFMSANGMWIFLAVGAIALFGIFLPITTWIEGRRKEREAFYKAETMRRISEAPPEAGNAAIQLLREQERIKAVKTREGLKMAGIINVGVGVGLLIFLRALIGAREPVYLCGLLPLFIGAAMIVYVYLMAPPID
jgi:hypothetical protein